MTAEDGPPFTPPEVAKLAGFSDSFIRLEMDAGELPFTSYGRGTKRRRRLITWRTVKTYLTRLGLLPHKSNAA